MNNRRANYAINRAIIAGDAKKINFLDPFLSLIKNILCEEVKLNKIFKIEFIEKELKRKFGIYIPRMALLTLLNELLKEDILERNTNDKNELEYKLIDYKNIKETNKKFNKSNKDYTLKYKYLVLEFIDYLKKNYKKEVVEKEAIKMLNLFLKEQSTYIHTNLEELNKKYSKDRLKYSDEYLVSNFLLHINDNNKEMKELIKEITLGFILAESMLERDIEEKPNENLKELTVYLDAPFIFNLLGINPINKRKSHLEMVENLKSKGVTLKVFQHTLNEVKRNLDIAFHFVENSNIDYGKITPATEYYVKKGLKKIDVREDIINLSKNIKKLGIEEEKISYENKKYGYNHDEKIIYSTILEEYKKNRLDLEESDVKDALLKDAKSVNGIYLSREDNKPLSLYEKNSIMITNNITLCLAVNKYNMKEYGERVMSPLMMDIHLATTIWLEEPLILEKISYDKLMSQVYASFSPDSKLWEKYLMEIEKLEEDEKIDIDTANLFRSDYSMVDLVMKMTWGDVDKLSEKTIWEMKEKIKQEGFMRASEIAEKERIEREAEIERERIESEKKLEAERKKNRKKEEKIEKKKEEIVEKEKRIEERIEKKSEKYVKRSMLILTTIILTLIYFVMKMIPELSGLLGKIIEYSPLIILFFYIFYFIIMDKDFDKFKVYMRVENFMRKKIKRVKIKKHEKKLNELKEKMKMLNEIEE